MEFSIRVAREEDAESIVELLNPIIQAGQYTAMVEQLSVDDQIDFIVNFLNEASTMWRYATRAKR